MDRLAPMPPNQDEVAKSMYGVGYNALSEWGKRTVSQAMGVVKPLDNDVALRQRVSALTKQLEEVTAEYKKLQISYKDIWDENEELRLDASSDMRNA